MANMPEKIEMPLPTFIVHGPTQINANSIESPFVLHWLEVQADRMVDHQPSQNDWFLAMRLLESAQSVAAIWGLPDEHSARLARKMEHARRERAKAV